MKFGFNKILEAVSLSRDTFEGTRECGILYMQLESTVQMRINLFVHCG